MYKVNYLVGPYINFLKILLFCVDNQLTKVCHFLYKLLKTSKAIFVIRILLHFVEKQKQNLKGNQDGYKKGLCNLNKISY